MQPSPPYLGLLLAACGKLASYIARGCQNSPRASYDYGSDSEEVLLDDEVTQAFSLKTATVSERSLSTSSSTEKSE